jgi:predicted transcriptional regulator
MKGRIEIQSLEEGLKDFRAAWKPAATGKAVAPRQGTPFTSLEAARRVLTPKRLELLRAIRRGRPASVSEFARFGLVSLTTTRAGRRTSVPRVPFSALEFRIAV